MCNRTLHRGGRGHHSASNLWSACNTQRQLQARRLGQCTSLDIESGIRLKSSRNSRQSEEYEQVCSRVTRSGHSTPYQVDTLRSIKSKCDSDSKRCKLSRLKVIDTGPKRVSPLSAFQITATKEGGMMVITTT